MRPSLSLLVPLLSLSLLTLPGIARETHVNKDVGYRILLPKDFEAVEKRSNTGSLYSIFYGTDSYTLDRFRSEKEIYPKEMPFGYRRSMSTYYFPERSAADLARMKKEEQDALEKVKDGDASILISGFDRKIYLSFEEYAKDQIQGFFFDKERDIKIGGFPATLYEMKFEKLSSVPQRWAACAIKIPGGEFAVLISCTDQHFSDYKSESNRVFSSFKLLDKAGLTVPESDNQITLQSDGIDEGDLTAEELVKRRTQKKEEAYAKCRDGLEAGWRHFETENYLIAYECPPKYAKLVGRHAEAIRKWLDKNLPSVGTGMVQSAIIRVYENGADVPNTWTFSIGDGTVPEFSFARPDSRGNSSEFEPLTTRIIDHWFDSKNDQLNRRMPSWLKVGLWGYLEDAELKGSNLTFPADEWEHDRMVDARNAQKKHEGPPNQAPLKQMKLLLTMPSEEVFSGQNGWFARAQCASVIRYLLDGPGRQNKKTKVILPHYLGHLYDLVEEVEKELKESRKAKRARKDGEANLSEEERLALEDEEYRKRRDQAYDKIARDLLTQAFERTFGEWSNRDWQTFDSSWSKYAEKNAK